MKRIFRLIVAAIALCLLAALVLTVVEGCAASAPTLQPLATATSLASAPTETTAPTVAAAKPIAKPKVSATSLDPLQAIAKSVQSFGTITSYRMTVVIEGGTPNENGTVNIEIAGKDYHFLSPRVEFYLIGNAFYLKQGANGQWRKLPSNSAAASGMTSTLLAPKDSLTSAITAHNATLSGTDILDGKPMLVYQYTLNNAPATLWVGVADGLPYKMEGISKTGAKTTVTISDYNAQIVLTPPIP